MIKWTDKQGNQFFWSSEIADMINYFFELEPAERLPQMTKFAAHIMGCSRCSIILKKKVCNHQDEKLILVAGYPNDKSAHGIGAEITREYGKDFLTRVIEGGTIILITDPIHDSRVAYMHALIQNKGIKNQLFVPLFYKKQKGGYLIPPFGVMTFDSTDGDMQRFEKIAVRVRKIAKLIVRFILNEERREKSELKNFRIASSRAFLENIQGFEDEFRNTTLIFQATAKKLLKEIDELEKEMPGNKIVQRAKDHAKIIIEAAERHGKKTNDFVNAIKPIHNLNLEEHDLRNFVEVVCSDFIEKKKAIGKEPKIILNFTKLPCNLQVNLDFEKMKMAIQAILENAFGSGANNIWVKVLIKEGKKDYEKILIAITNDGKRMSQQTGEQLLQYLASSDRSSGKGGLAIVKSIVRAHGGEVDLKWQSMTQFIIQLPLE